MLQWNACICEQEGRFWPLSRFQSIPSNTASHVDALIRLKGPQNMWWHAEHHHHHLCRISPAVMKLPASEFVVGTVLMIHCCVHRAALISWASGRSSARRRRPKQRRRQRPWSNLTALWVRSFCRLATMARSRCVCALFHLLAFMCFSAPGAASTCCLSTMQGLVVCWHMTL